MVAEAGADIDSVKVVMHAAFVNREYVWSFPMTPDRVPALVAQNELKPLDSKDVPAQFFKRFPSAWGPAPKPTAAYYATPDFPADSTVPGGDYLMLMHDPGANRLFVWCKLNFGIMPASYEVVVAQWMLRLGAQLRAGARSDSSLALQGEPDVLRSRGGPAPT